MGGLCGRFIVALISCWWRAWCEDCMHSQNAQQQNGEEKKLWKKERKWEIEPSAALCQTHKRFQGRHGRRWRCFVWRWHQWCQQPASWLTLLLQTHFPCLLGVTAVINLKCHAMTSTDELSAAARYTCREAQWGCRGSLIQGESPTLTLRGDDTFIYAVLHQKLS